ncbi:MAG: 3-deoxy-7-phosphoheptulonate synthase [Pantoea sp. Brub]|nr:3-deoxy-7-phosphoheptulonate synthase [Pantoea sp. Brub]
MHKHLTNNIHITNEKTLITPKKLKLKFPIDYQQQLQILSSRKIISNIISGKDISKLLVVCGPCSIHDTEAAIDYGIRLNELAKQLKNNIYLVMRVYFEKPRTTIGWKGLINDPYIDNSFDMEEGLHIARKLLISLIKIGLPLATETLDPNNPQYLGDLFSWSAIGARTTESQIHREIASGLSTPIGFKNTTNGSLNPAINAISTAAKPHCFVGINQAGKVCLLHTKGNPYGHIILRGGKTPNYNPENITYCTQKMIKAGLHPAIMVDCSHGNSNKNHHFQINVAKSIISQIKHGNRSIIGIMLESNINEGNQSYKQPRNKMKYGVSITDSCINWKETETLLINIQQDLQGVLSVR